ncbi:MAG TPA: flagellar biosynthesis anti-sigma factor FlgM [Candidatus Deferrimicrobium sp.]|nr:flagellar biosynthesis anti-sigma factor FlgM [Candidatus Deferrimicrobium sp.]
MNISTNTGGIDKMNRVLIRKDLKKIKDTGKENKTGIFDTEDKIEISFKTFDLNALQTSVMQFPDVRPEKVADIKTRVDNGTYTISYEELAERLIEDASTA